MSSRLLHCRKLCVELRDDLVAMLTLSRLLVRVVTDHVTLASLPIANRHLLHPKVVTYHLVAPGPAKHVLGHFVSRTHARPKDVLAVA